MRMTTIKNAKTQKRIGIVEAESEFIKHCKLKNLREETLRYYEEDIEYFFSTAGTFKYVDEVTQQVYEDWLVSLIDAGKKTTSLNTRIRGLRVFFRFMVEREYMKPLEITLMKEDAEEKEPYTDAELVVSYTDGGITQTANQPITVSIKTYDYTKSTVISAGGSYTLSGIGATHRNIRVVCIGGGTGGKGGKNGSSGRAGGSASVKKQQGYDIASNGAGGAGGSGGTAGTGGKIFQKDFIIPKLTDTFTISIGSGGAGGSTNTAGSAGGNTTFTYNGTTASSATGSSSSTGYTNTFTNATYAVIGEDGIAGGDGGDGFEITSVSGTRNYSWYYNDAKNGSSVTYKGTTYKGGTIYTQDKGMISYNNSTIGVVAGGGGSGGASAGNNSATGNYSRINGSQQSPRFKAWSADGGRGASAVAPSAPTTYGNGGNGGNGGGGGGGASGGCAIFAEDIYLPSNTTFPYENDVCQIYAGAGGAGGSGSSGSSGAQGCVIIYFS